MLKSKHTPQLNSESAVGPKKNSADDECHLIYSDVDENKSTTSEDDQNNFGTNKISQSQGTQVVRHAARGGVTGVRGTRGSGRGARGTARGALGPRKRARRRKTAEEIRVCGLTYYLFYSL